MYAAKISAAASMLMLLRCSAGHFRMNADTHSSMSCVQDASFAGLAAELSTTRQVLHCNAHNQLRRSTVHVNYKHVN